MTNKPILSDRISKLTGSVAREILSRTASQDITSFAGGLPDPTLWQDIQIPTPNLSSFQYGPSEGDQNLREVFAQRMQENGIKTNCQTTLILSGSQQGIDLVAKLLIDKGSIVLVEEPTYLAALQVFQLFEAQVIGVPMDSQGMIPAALSEAIQNTSPALVYLNPTFQNPTGTNYSKTRRFEIAEVLQKTNTVVLEDDPYRELDFESNAPTPPIVSQLETNWIYLNSASKMLMPGLRIGALACSKNLLDPLLKLKQAADLHTNRISQSIAYQFLTNKAFLKTHTEKVIECYRNKRDIMAQALANGMSEFADWDIPQGGMFFWLRLKEKHNLRSLMEECLEHEIAIMPGDPFFSDEKNHDYHIRLNFTHPKSSDITSGINRIIKTLHSRTHPETTLVS